MTCLSYVCTCEKGDTCGSCGGTGEVLQNISPNSLYPQYELKRCHSCAGSGLYTPRRSHHFDHDKAIQAAINAAREAMR